VTSLLFGFEHREWLAGIFCGFAYQGLVCWKKRLGDAITAHAITNALLGYWVSRKDNGSFGKKRTGPKPGSRLQFLKAISLRRLQTEELVRCAR